MKYGLPQDTVNQIKQVLAGFPEVTRAVLYGSRAKGNHKPGSDIDLTLFGKVSLELCASIADALDELLLPYTIDLSVFALLNHPELEAHIHRVGLVFYEKGAQGPSRQADF